MIQYVESGIRSPAGPRRVLGRLAVPIRAFAGRSGKRSVRLGRIASFVARRRFGSRYTGQGRSSSEIGLLIRANRLVVNAPFSRALHHARLCRTPEDHLYRLDHAREHLIGLYRIVIGLLFACHGFKTIFGVFGAHAPAPLGAWPGWWAALIQLVCGLLVCVGVVSRPAAIIGSGSMAYAYFTVHLPKGLLPIENGGEAAALFCWSLLIVAFAGPGLFALGRLRSRPATTTEEPVQPIPSSV
jgi:putative oxidoreductase